VYDITGSVFAKYRRHDDTPFLSFVHSERDLSSAANDHIPDESDTPRRVNTGGSAALALHCGGG
jgi:hypothetical protein